MTARFLTVLLLVPLLAVAPAKAHHNGTEHEPAPSGLVIPSLGHGQMIVLAANLDAILRLADAQVPTDPDMRKLQGYVALQKFACLWGIVPGSVTDEASPFNECAHAYLAGARALLLHLQRMPGANRPVADALADRIERQMLAAKTSLILCRYSDRPFNTSEIIVPPWREVLLNPAGVAGLGIVLLTALAAGAFWRRGRRAAA